MRRKPGTDLNFRRLLPEIRCLSQGLPRGIRCPFTSGSIRSTVSLDEQFSRDAKVSGQLLSLGLADAALAIHKVGHLSTRTEHGNKICLLQPALFHQELDHLV